MRQTSRPNERTVGFAARAAFMDAPNDLELLDA